MCAFVNHINEEPGPGEWIEDEDFDLHQEIARAAYADMLHDHERNEKYFFALAKAIKKMKACGRPANVLDIGTGTGLLSMMAARLGADSIVACEAFVPMAKCAKEIMKENGFADRIHLVPKRSTQMTVGINGDMESKANILVTEVFDSDFIGEGAIFTFKHALEELLEDDPIVVPSSGRVFIEVIESEMVRRWRKLNDITVDSNKIIKVPLVLEECPGSYSVHDLQLSQFPTDQFKTIVEPQVVFSFDFMGKIKLEFNRKSEIQCCAKRTGTAHAAFMWWEITMDTEGDIILSCAPHWAHPSPEAKNGHESLPWRDHWMQEIYYFPKDVSVVKEQSLNLICCHDEYGFWFDLVSSQNKISPPDKSIVQPACLCNLHMICSYSRIGMLNDPLRREKYISALKRVINEKSIVLSIGDCSLLPLIASCLGAKKVYCQESSLFSRGVISEFIKTNNLFDKIELIGEKADGNSKYSYALSDIILMDDVNLILTEPFFSPAFLPWHHLRWKPSEFSTDCLMFPVNASVWALPANFDHLHKIRAPLHKVFDFSMAQFDQLVSSSSAISDSPIELQPLWEYGTTSLSNPFKLFDFNLNKEQPDNDINIQRCINIEACGRFDALVLWVEYELDNDISISDGPVDRKSVKPGEKVVWDMYTKQAVCFVDQFKPIFVSAKDKLCVNSIYKSKEKDILLNIDLMCENGKEYKNVSGAPLSKFNYLKKVKCGENV